MKKIATISAYHNKKALTLQNFLTKHYNFINLNDIANNFSHNFDFDLIIAIGGDGLMLHLLHHYYQKNIPIYGINCGTVGFLMNSFKVDCHDIMTKINLANINNLHPLLMQAKTITQETISHIAFNEVSLLRQTSQACKICIKINHQERLNPLISDGILVATSAGSTAYNFSVGGSIIPFEAPILALTAISPFRPKKWSGALLPNQSIISLDLLEYKTRSASVTADWKEVKNVMQVQIKQDFTSFSQILFDANHSLEERILCEQFS
jgi:NAD+ kinase